MTIIDRLDRIELSGLKPFFRNLKRIKQSLDRWEEEHPSKSEEDIILFRKETLSKMKDYLTGKCTFGESLTIHIEADIDFVDSVEVEGFNFRWEHEGETRLQSVKLEKRPSNLGKPEPVYYFVCPYSGTLCRKLYTDGKVLAGRKSFSHIYSTQQRSERIREVDNLMAILDSPQKGKYRKEYYRGKLTPYGWRLSRGFRLSRKLGITNGAQACSRLDFMLVSCRRGRRHYRPRPSKPSRYSRYRG